VLFSQLHLKMRGFPQAHYARVAAHQNTNFLSALFDQL
jgi:hypothetical protein